MLGTAPVGSAPAILSLLHPWLGISVGPWRTLSLGLLAPLALLALLEALALEGLDSRGGRRPRKARGARDSVL